MKEAKKTIFIMSKYLDIIRTIHSPTSNTSDASKLDCCNQVPKIKGDKWKILLVKTEYQHSP